MWKGNTKILLIDNLKFILNDLEKGEITPPEVANVLLHLITMLVSRDFVDQFMEDVRFTGDVYDFERKTSRNLE